MPRAPRLGDWISLFTLTVLWGSAFLLNELALGSFSPQVLVAGRIVIAALVFLTYARVRGVTLPRSLSAWIPLLVIAVFGNVLPFNLIAWAQQHIDSSLAGILMAVMPLFVLTLAHFFIPGGKLTPFRVAGFVVGFSGVVVVIGPNIAGGLDGDLAFWGALAALGAAFSYALSSIYTRRLGAADPVRLSAGMLLVASALSAPAAVIDLPHLSLPSAAAVLALLGLGLLSTGFATLLYFRLIQGPGPAFLSLVNYLVPAWAVAAGAVFLGESLSLSTVIGLALILCGIATGEFGPPAIRFLKSLRSNAALAPVAREDV
ncbi:MAG: DMT family transporter [Woeseiaceae bacterium]|nr:DMT family transporter [Woeseiaceae bacterium]